MYPCQERKEKLMREIQLCADELLILRRAIRRIDEELKEVRYKLVMLNLKLGKRGDEVGSGESV